jgi:predicted small secreted protein
MTKNTFFKFIAILAVCAIVLASCETKKKTGCPGRLVMNSTTQHA